MRVLTVRQPWAWAIIHGGKDVENRVRSLGPYRGPVAIHASLSLAPAKRGERIAGGDVEFERDLSGFLARSARFAWPYRVPEHRGAIIGVVELADTHWGARCGNTEGRAPARLCSDWAMPDHQHLVLARPHPLPRPVPAKGRLGLWRPDAALEAAILEQLGGAA